MKVVKKTGLVPVRMHKGRTDPFGVSPAMARELLQAGDAELFPIPDGIETIEVPGVPAPRKDAPEKSDEPDEVAIPEDWEGQHFLTWLTLAEKISGSKPVATDDKKATEVAKEIIAAEVQRRAAAAQSAE